MSLPAHQRQRQAFADTVTLRTRIEASGPAITLGDVFDAAGEVAGRAISPAPGPVQVGTLSMPLLAAAASAAGLDFTPPPGVNSVQVVRPGGMRATLPASNGARSMADAAVRRGESVTLIYEVPGVALSMRARALEDGAGELSRLFGCPERPEFCASLKPLASMCGASREEALQVISALEIATRPR